jgi:hypothetical protein
VRERQKSNLPIYKFAQQWRRRRHDVWEKEEEVEVLLNCFAAAALGIRSRARTQPANCQRKTIFPTLCLNFGKSASNTISRQQLPQAPLDINISAHG